MRPMSSKASRLSSAQKAVKALDPVGKTTTVPEGEQLPPLAGPGVSYEETVNLPNGSF